MIIEKNKIKITKDKLYSYWDFKKELEDRNLYGQEGESYNRVSAMDSTSKYVQEFTEVNNPANEMIYVGEDRKFPFLYMILIQQ